MGPCLIFRQNNIKPTSSIQWRAIQEEVAQTLTAEAEYLHLFTLAHLWLHSTKCFKRQVCFQEKVTHAKCLPDSFTCAANGGARDRKVRSRGSSEQRGSAETSQDCLPPGAWQPGRHRAFFPLEGEGERANSLPLLTSWAQTSSDPGLQKGDEENPAGASRQSTRVRGRKEVTWEGFVGRITRPLLLLFGQKRLSVVNMS